MDLSSKFLTYAFSIQNSKLNIRVFVYPANINLIL